MKKLLLTLIIVLTSLSVFSQEMTLKDIAGANIGGTTIRYTKDLGKGNYIIEYTFLAIDIRPTGEILVTGSTPKGNFQKVCTETELVLLMLQDWSSNGYTYRIFHSYMAKNDY